MEVHPVADKIRNALGAVRAESPFLTEASEVGRKMWRRRWDFIAALMIELAWAVMMALAKWASQVAQAPAKVLLFPVPRPA